jgi:hypothetical protein
MARVREQVMNAKTKTMLDLDNPTLDWVQMSTSLGVPATRAATAEEFHREFEAALAAKGAPADRVPGCHRQRDGCSDGIYSQNALKSCVCE